jgi:uncharacterized spore protein YtfJ
MLNANRVNLGQIRYAVKHRRFQVVNVEEVLNQARDNMTVKRVFGDPIEKDGVTVIPVAKISGGGGGGGGQDDEGASGGGVGYGLKAEPVGAYIISNGELTWRPAMPPVDVTKIVVTGNVVLIALLLVIRSILVSRRK